MPFRQTPDTNTKYTLIAFDAKGAERTDDPDGLHGLLSTQLLKQVTDSAPTDIFLFSHGWMGDLDAAARQYDLWIGAMNRLPADAARMNPGFHPLWIGVHWPSEPFGQEEFSGMASFSIDAPVSVTAGAASTATAAALATAPAPVAELLESYLGRLELTDSPRARELLTQIFASNRQHAAPRTLPSDVASAYGELAGLLNFESKGVGAAPGSDTATFNPQAAFDAMNGTGIAFGGGIVGGLLGPLRTLSFWTMKRRARTIGEQGLFQLVSSLMKAAPKAAVHLMGHSFGTIVVSSLCAAAQNGTPLPRPIDTLALIQGAVSLWSYADKIPATGGAGYFNAMFNRGAVRGPILTTQSTHDLAVKILYPAAVGLMLENPDFDPSNPFPKWGGIGTFGIQGLARIVRGNMLPATGEYHFQNGQIYNLEASDFIRQMQPVVGAHSDIGGPEVAHALWQLVAPPMPVPFGVQAETGNLLPALKPAALDHVGQDPASVHRRADQPGQVFGVVAEVNADDLAQSGWGIIFASTMAQDQAAVKAALKPLLDLRKQQAGALYTEFEGATGYTKDVDADDWLADRGSSLTVVDPKQGVPYYLLLVGSADDIPFDFQYDLDTFFAVGRLYFENVDEYRQYAQNIVAYEQAATIPHGKTIALFAPRNDGDAATQLLHDNVAAPLANGDTDRGMDPLGKSQGYSITKRLADQATKPELLNILRGTTEAGTPALLFTGSHGVAFSPDDPDQKEKQGALLTQSWHGPGTPVNADTFLTAADVAQSAKLSGTIHFFFACYSAGCPTSDTYNYEDGSLPKAIAKQAIVARLPQQLLLNGAQAVIGHIDRAWAYSFQVTNGPVMVQNIRDPLVRILDGKRVGDAMDFFNQRWSVLSNPLVKMINQRAAAPQSVSSSRLANCWVARDDARNYIVLGDPAVKLRNT